MADLVIRKAANDLRDSVISNQVSKTGLKSKIDAKCAESIYDPYQQGTWFKQVENCTSLTCLLFSVRPIDYRQNT